MEFQINRIHQKEQDLPTGGNWVVQKFGGTSVGKFAVGIAQDIVLYVGLSGSFGGVDVEECLGQLLTLYTQGQPERAPHSHRLLCAQHCD